MKYAGIDQFDLAYLIGFDCYGANVYLNTNGYAAKQMNPSRYRSFLRHYETALKEYPRTMYINIIKDGMDGLSKALGKYDNYATANMDTFFDNLNKFPYQEARYHHDEFRKTKTL
jgi:hypothetical protein